MLTGPSSGLASRCVVVMARRPTTRNMDVRRLGGTCSACLSAEVCVRRSLVPICPSRLTSPLKTGDALADRLGHYAFRPLLRGMIQHGDGFTPDETTSYGRCET
jgi:hypothetical protein